MTLLKKYSSDFTHPPLLSFIRYDAFSSILGEGKPFVGIDNSYLQSGHTVLLALVLVCGFIELPGFPLTSLPYDVREFLKVRQNGLQEAFRSRFSGFDFLPLPRVRVEYPSVILTYSGWEPLEYYSVGVSRGSHEINGLLQA